MVKPKTNIDRGIYHRLGPRFRDVLRTDYITTQTGSRSHGWHAYERGRHPPGGRDLVKDLSDQNRYRNRKMPKKEKLDRGISRFDAKSYRLGKLHGSWMTDSVKSEESAN